MPERRSTPADWLLIALMSCLAHPVITVAGVGALVATGFVGVWPMLLPAGLFVVSGLTGPWLAPDVPLGRAVRTSVEPELTGLVRGAAEKLGLRVPIAVRILPIATASLSSERFGRRRIRTVNLGWPLIRTMTARQLEAVVAHELAHVPDLDDRRWTRLMHARETLAESLDDQVRAPRALVVKLLAATQKRSWQGEFDADTRAAGVVGAGRLAEAMQVTERLGAVFDLVASDWLDDLDDGTYAADLYEALHAAAADPLVAARAIRAEREPEAVPEAESHPEWRARIDALRARPAHDPDQGPVVRMREAAAVEDWFAVALVSMPDEAGDEDGDGPPPRAVRIAGLPADRFGPDAAQTREVITDVTGLSDPRDGLARMLRMIADGELREFAHRVDLDVDGLPGGLRDQLDRRIAVTVTAEALAVLLVEAGWQPASPWITAALRPPAGGAPLDLHLLLEQAVDGRDVSHLTRLLGAAA